MDLDLNQTQEIFRDTVREFMEAEVPFSRVREHEQARTTDAELWAALHRHGWLGVALPSELGGGDAGLIEAGLLVEEVQRRAALVPVAESLACAVTLHRHGPADHAPDQVRSILSGRITVVPAILEASDRFDRIEAEVTGDGRIRGEKLFVDYADCATHHLAAARRNGELGLFLIDTTGATVKSEPTRSIGRLPQARVHYDGAAAEPICGEEGYGFLIRLGRALCAVQALACMQQALDMTVAYTSIREQFGRPIGTFQAVQHHAANMAIQIASTRFLVYEALDAIHRGTATDEQVAVAKAAASESVPEVTMLAHQLHGGQGFIEENDLYFFSLRGKDRGLAWGTTEECLALLGESITRKEEWV